MTQSSELIHQAPKVMEIATTPVPPVDPNNFGQILQTEVLTMAHIAEFAGLIAIGALALWALKTFQNGRAKSRFYADNPFLSSHEGPTHNAWGVRQGRQDYFPVNEASTTDRGQHGHPQTPLQRRLQRPTA